ncbi:MAG: nucleotidyltransferase [Candidatus Aminicenantes bacterium]|nr:nucleotidyltransferase [Candidatus Aminicenantes bacterium]
MNALESALIAICRFLQRQKIPYMVIGGMANAVWGEPRATLDIDITIWIEDAKISKLTRSLAPVFKLLPENPSEFISKTRVLPIATQASTRIDLLLGMLPFEETAISRAIEINIQGIPVRFCTAEDLILHKIISDRDKDLHDAEKIVARQKNKLDMDYLEPRIEELAGVLEKPAILKQWRAWKKKAG